LILFLKFL